MYIYYVTLKTTGEEVMAFGHGSIDEALENEGLTIDDIENNWWREYMD